MNEPERIIPMQTNLTHQITIETAAHNTTHHNQEQREAGGPSSTQLALLTDSRDNTISMRSPQQRSISHLRMPLSTVNVYHTSQGISLINTSYNEQSLQDLTDTSALITEEDKQEIITLIQLNLAINTLHGHQPERYLALSERLYDNRFFNNSPDLTLLLHTLSLGAITFKPVEQNQFSDVSLLPRSSSQPSPDKPITADIEEILLSKGLARLHALVGYYAFLAQQEPQMDSRTKAIHIALFLVRAQPFSDGNHRTATRALINCSAIISSEKKQQLKQH